MKKYTFCLIFTMIAFCLIICTPDLRAQNEEISPLKTFKKLEVIGKINVNLIVSKEFKMEMTLEGIEREKISIVNEEGSLKIKIVNTFSYKDVRVLIKIYCDNVSEIGAYSSASVFSEETLVIDTISLEAESGGEISLKIFADSIVSSCASKGLISIAGKTMTHYARVLSGGTLSSTELECDKCIISAGSKGIARIKVINDLQARATTGAYISYIGEPSKKSLETTLNGKIEKVDY